MKLSILIAAPLASFVSAVAIANNISDDLTVDLGYELYQGYYNFSTNQNVWQGIRYASSTAGQNRFRRPQPPETNREAVLPATSLPQRCPQGPQAPLPRAYNYTGTEDCLFLSVYSPANASNLPVFVWMYVIRKLAIRILLTFAAMAAAMGAVKGIRMSATSQQSTTTASSVWSSNTDSALLAFFLATRYTDSAMLMLVYWINTMLFNGFRLTSLRLVVTNRV